MALKKFTEKLQKEVEFSFKVSSPYSTIVNKSNKNYSIGKTSESSHESIYTWLW